MGQYSKNLNIVHVNIRGLYTSRTELELMIDEVKPDVITINETFLNKTDRLKINNYNILRKARKDGTRRGGVAILYKQSIPATEVQLPDQFKDLEAIALKINLPNWPIHISTIYSPPGEPLPSEIISHLSSYHKSILLSDLNAHHPYLGDNPINTNRQGKDLVELIEHINFKNVLLSGPTRFPSAINQTFIRGIQTALSCQC